MTNFEYAYNKTLGLEGGLCDDPDDAGGKTNCGITERTLETAKKIGIVPLDLTIETLTDKYIRIIYKALYWDLIRLNDVLDKDISAEIFDTCVNMGPSAAVLIAQRAINYLSTDQIKEDGVMGPLTIEKLNFWAKKDRRALFVCLNGEQYIEYKFIRRLRNNYKFARGWTKRIQQYQA